jgi:hypothetical protein
MTVIDSEPLGCLVTAVNSASYWTHLYQPADAPTYEHGEVVLVLEGPFERTVFGASYPNPLTS